LNICISPTTGAFSLEDFLLAKKVMLLNAVILISQVRSYYIDDLFFKLSLLFLFFFFEIFVKLIVFNIDIVERLLEIIKYFIAVLHKRIEEKKSKQKTYKHKIRKKIVKTVSDSNNNNDDDVKSCESKVSTTSSTLNELFKKIPPFKRIDLNLECGLHLYLPPPPLLTNPDFVNKLYDPDEDEIEVEFKIMYYLTGELTLLGSNNVTSKDYSYLIRIKKVFFFFGLKKKTKTKYFVILFCFIIDILCQ
jgi:Ca2+/Na+ antiporter